MQKAARDLSSRRVPLVRVPLHLLNNEPNN
jgi:hypothetical protein